MGIMIHLFHIISILFISTDYIISQIRKKEQVFFFPDLVRFFAIHLTTLEVGEFLLISC